MFVQTRRILTISALVVSFCATGLWAAVKTSDSVANIFNAPQNGKAVSLQGKLTQDAASGSYLFKDETGQIQVKISSEVMVPDATTENATVEIMGVVKTQGKKSPRVDVGALTVRTTYVEEVTEEPKVSEPQTPVAPVSPAVPEQQPVKP